tara:strand:- start:1590 stop:2342 length:753 start_codon:yes stop_codon:yes gene_type:complete
MLDILVLSLIQGITEFLPISSSSHLILASDFLNFTIKNLSQDVSLHIGSFLAVIIYFRDDIFNFVKEKKLFFKIFIASLPTIFVGAFLVLFDYAEKLRGIEIIAWTTLIFGILLFLSDKSSTKHSIKKLNYKDIFIIGFFQILSLIPGVSRAGITITAARFLNFDRVSAAKISFLISIPTLAAVSIYGLYKIIMHDEVLLKNINILSLIFSFIFSYITINFFLKYIKKFNLNIFVFYRLIVGIILLVLIY